MKNENNFRIKGFISFDGYIIQVVCDLIVNEK